MNHFMKQAQTYNVRRHIQNETRNPQHSLLVVELRTKEEIPSEKYQYIKPIVPRKDIVDNALMVLSTTYAGSTPSQTDEMQRHFRYVREQLWSGLMSLEEVYKQVQGYMGYHYEVLVAPKDNPDFMFSANGVSPEPVRDFTWQGIRLTCCRPANEGFHGWAEVV